MRILLSNDDGYHAPGLQALALALRERGDTVWVCAPKNNKSGTSCSLTLDRPIAVHAVSDTDFMIDGTPADCVHIALTGIASVSAFDLVVSGINDGANLGDDAIHSGTLGAATQAHLYGLPALAVSLYDKGWTHLNTAVALSLTVIDQLSQQAMPALWNLNIPNATQVPALQWARVGRRTPSLPVQAFCSPKGESFYWLGSAGDEIVEAGTDIAALAAGRASLTPIALDRTDLAALSGFLAS